LNNLPAGIAPQQPAQNCCDCLTIIYPVVVTSQFGTNAQQRCRDAYNGEVFRRQAVAVSRSIYECIQPAKQLLINRF